MQCLNSMFTFCIKYIVQHKHIRVGTPRRLYVCILYVILSPRGCLVAWITCGVAKRTVYLLSHLVLDAKNNRVIFKIKKNYFLAFVPQMSRLI